MYKATMQHITVLGAGVLGAQIVFQSAYMGKDVVVYDISEEILAKLPQHWEMLKKQYRKDVPDASDEKLNDAVTRIHATTDLSQALHDADIVIEAVPERLDIKRTTWEQVSKLAPKATIFCTNSSTLLPSVIATFTDRPDRFLALHFANQIWRNNTAEIMVQAHTDAKVADEVVDFAKEIGMVPIRLRKEQPGYVLNSLLLPLLNAAADLWMRDVASIEDIDATWRIATGAPAGPFQIYDVIGMMTPYNLCRDSADPRQREFAKRIKSEYIDRGWMGRDSGRGFYDYQ